MTPFHLRDRLRRLIGGAEPRPEPEPTPRHRVRFELPDGEVYEAEANVGDSLVLASGRGPRPIATGCADGTCGTCQVEVIAGADQLTPPTDHEERTKAMNEVPAHRRLGCQTRVTGPGVAVKVIHVFDAENFA